MAFDGGPWEQAAPMLAHFRHWIRQHPRQYQLVGTVAEIRRARRDGRLGVFFDIEGGSALNGQLSMVELYRDLGLPISLALPTGQPLDRRDLQLMRDVVVAGGSVVPHSVHHLPNWGGSYLRARGEAAVSRAWISRWCN